MYSFKNPYNVYSRERERGRHTSSSRVGGYGRNIGRITKIKITKVNETSQVISVFNVTNNYITASFQDHLEVFVVVSSDGGDKNLLFHMTCMTLDTLDIVFTLCC